MGKMDPYLQIDAWTMSPFEHGETFVTTDWFETDLDLWHYERFINEELTKYSSTTTGQIYLSVIKKERRWEYLWKTVQVIPHIINEVKHRIMQIAEWSDVAIIEIWWTVGDIEWPHFIETMRQFRHELGRENVLFVHIAPIVTVTTSWEMKTKAIQHSIIKLRELWIQADILICRTPNPLEEWLKKKLSMFCDLEEDCIIENLDQNIYELPLSFQKQWLDRLIIKRLFNEDKSSDLSKWEDLVNKLKNPESEITIWIAGKYTHLDDSYISVVEALKHAWAHYSTKINIEWIDTEKFESDWRENEFANLCNSKNISWIVVPWWFGNRWIQWMINIATFCMKKDIPYLWLCLWLQIATIAFARFVCNIPQANSWEFTPENEYNVIDIMEEQRTISDKWWTMRLWSYDAVLKENTETRELYKEFNQIDISSNIVKERHRHRYEVNPKFHEILSKNWLVFSGLSPNWKLVEFIELPELSYFLATQAHPEFKSRLNRPHPLFAWLVKSCLNI
jgi:CTP synthase